MFQSKRTAVVIPAHNEATLLPRVLRGLPAWVDLAIVVDDASTDATAQVARAVAEADPRLHVLHHPRRRGVGAAIATGYAEAIRLQADLVAVMAGDDQMDPQDLPSLLAPAASGDADYVKGDRMAWRSQWSEIPRVRRWGNRLLSVLTRFITGAPALSDAQCGYTVITRVTLERLSPQRIYPGYGYPNDILARLARIGARVAQVPVHARYGIGERSKMRLHRVALPLAWLLVRHAVVRLGDRLRAWRLSGTRPGVRMLPPSGSRTAAHPAARTSR